MHRHSYPDDEVIARAMQEEEDAAMARSVGAAPPAAYASDVELVGVEHLACKRWYLVVFALLDVCGIFLLLLQRSDDGFPLSTDAFAERLDNDLTSLDWFTPLLVSLAFPVLGILGTLLLHRWMLWTYVAWLLVAIGALAPAMSNTPSPHPRRPLSFTLPACTCLAPSAHPPADSSLTPPDPHPPCFPSLSRASNFGLGDWTARGHRRPDPRDCRYHPLHRFCLLGRDHPPEELLPGAHTQQVPAVQEHGRLPAAAPAGASPRPEALPASEGGAQRHSHGRPSRQ